MTDKESLNPAEYHKQHDHCGCCGACLRLNGSWCDPCKDHLGPFHLMPWDQTYSAQHGEPCPYEES